MEIEKIKLFRITHIENVPHILLQGITHKNSRNANKNFISIGDVSLIETRSRKKVDVDNGGLSNSNTRSITLGDFIPFYFGVKMPMLYVIQQGGNFVYKATPPNNIVYLVCSLAQIVESNIEYFFSDGHATDNLTTFYGSGHISHLPKIVNWDAVRAPYWGGNENLNIKRKKQAEFFVSSDLPPEFIVGFGCYDDAAKLRLLEMGINDQLVKVIPTAYF